ncbi:MAG: hypothetical protein QW343_04250 [Candidatus Norongarragalinales archaeon]
MVVGVVVAPFKVIRQRVAQHLNGEFPGTTFKFSKTRRHSDAQFVVVNIDVPDEQKFFEVVDSLQKNRTNFLTGASSQARDKLFWVARHPNIRGVVALILAPKNYSKKQIDVICDIHDAISRRPAVTRKAPIKQKNVFSRALF